MPVVNSDERLMTEGVTESLTLPCICICFTLMTQQPLQYQPQPTRLHRWMRRLTPIANHVLAFAITLMLLTLLPLIIFTAVWLILLMISLLTPSDDSGFVAFLFVGLLIISIVGISSTLAICLLNVIFECIRKPLRWPIWTSPLLFCGAAWLITFMISLIQRQSLFSVIITPVTFSLGLTFFFAMYWVPLAISESITDWLKCKLSRRWPTQH